MSWLDRFNSWYVHAIPDDVPSAHVHWTEPLAAARVRQRAAAPRAVLIAALTGAICTIVLASARPATGLPATLAGLVIVGATYFSSFIPPTRGWFVDLSPLRLRIVRRRAMRRIALRRIQRVIFWLEDGARLMSINDRRGELLRVGVAPELEPAVIELFRRAGIEVDPR